MPSPHSGTFDIDRQHSDWSNGQFPPNMALTVNLSIDGDDFEYHAVNTTRSKENPYTVDFTAKLDGQPYPSTGHGVDHVALRRRGDDEYQLIKTLNGDITAVEYWRFEDGDDLLVKHGTIQREDGLMAYVESFRRR